MKKQQIYNRIAQATIKALREQAENGKVNNLTTETVYQAIDEAISVEMHGVISALDDAKETLTSIASGENLSKEQMMSLAQHATVKLH